MEGFLNPEEVLKQLKLKEDMVASDFGCGSGGWVIPLAKKLENGKVYAIDILEEPLSALRAKVKLEKISNVQIILADIEKGVETLKEASCDLVLMTNLLFQVKTTPDVEGLTSGVKRVLTEGERVLKSAGRILVVDWKKDVSLGPKEDGVSPEEVKEIALALNLRIEREFDASPYHYAIILAKSRSEILARSAK